MKFCIFFCGSTSGRYSKYDEEEEDFVVDSTRPLSPRLGDFHNIFYILTEIFFLLSFNRNLTPMCFYGPASSVSRFFFVIFSTSFLRSFSRYLFIYLLMLFFCIFCFHRLFIGQTRWCRSVTDRSPAISPMTISLVYKIFSRAKGYRSTTVTRYLSISPIFYLFTCLFNS